MRLDQFSHGYNGTGRIDFDKLCETLWMEYVMWQGMRLFGEAVRGLNFRCIDHVSYTNGISSCIMDGEV